MDHTSADVSVPARIIILDHSRRASMHYPTPDVHTGSQRTAHALTVIGQYSKMTTTTAQH
jgi:hypothetical protein